MPLQGCDEVEAYVRQTLTASVNRTVNQQLKSIRESEYVPGCYGPMMDSGAAPPSAAGGAPSSDSGKGASQTSGTNNQVAGVDEADFVKNDKEYVYAVTNGALRIIKAWPAAETHVVARVPIEGGEPRKLFVEGDRALVYVAVPPVTSAGGRGASWSPRTECTYGYECIPRGDGTRTKAIVFDISNRAAPTKIREIEFSGSLLAARRIGNAVHTVVHDDASAVEDLESYPQVDCDYNLPINEKRIRMISGWEALRRRNVDRIARADLRSHLPSIREGAAPAVEACSGYYRPSLSEGGSFTSVVSLDIQGGPLTSATVVSDPGVVYASDTSLYMSIPHTRVDGGDWYGSMANSKNASTVHRFRIGRHPVATGYVASGIVEGRRPEPVRHRRSGRRPARRDDDGPRSGPERSQHHERASPAVGNALVAPRQGRPHRAHRGHPHRALRRLTRLRRHVQEDRPAVRSRPGNPERAEHRRRAEDPRVLDLHAHDGRNAPAHHRLRRRRPRRNFRLVSRASCSRSSTCPT